MELVQHMQRLKDMFLSLERTEQHKVVLGMTGKAEELNNWQLRDLPMLRRCCATLLSNPNRRMETARLENATSAVTPAGILPVDTATGCTHTMKRQSVSLADRESDGSWYHPLSDPISL